MHHIFNTTHIQIAFRDLQMELQRQICGKENWGNSIVVVLGKKTLTVDVVRLFHSFKSMMPYTYKFCIGQR